MISLKKYIFFDHLLCTICVRYWSTVMGFSMPDIKMQMLKLNTYLLNNLLKNYNGQKFILSTYKGCWFTFN